MISINTLKLYNLCLALVAGLHLAFVDAFPSREPNITLEEHKIINDKIEFLKLNQKGCSQAVFVYDQQEPNCTISIWYTGAFHMWMLRNDIVREFKQASVQELRTLPIQLCTCKKVHVSDLCPADAHNVTDNLLHSCKDFIETSNGVPVVGVVADSIMMVNDVKKLENISVSLDYTTKINLSVGENSVSLTTLGSLNEKIDAPGNEDTAKETAEVKSSAKDGLKDDDNQTSPDNFNGRNELNKDMKLGSEDIDSRGVKKDEGINSEKHEFSETKDDADNDENDSMKYGDAKQNIPPKHLNSTERKISFKTNGNLTEVEKNEDLENVDKKIEDDLTDSEVSRKGDDSENNDDSETKGEIKLETDDDGKEKETIGAAEGTVKMTEKTTSETPLAEDEDSESENSDEDNDDDLMSF